jgi:preprotein translocase subunit SecD
VKRRRLIASLLGIILVAMIALSATLIAGRSPLLGLDLRGGLSVVLQPQGKVTDATLQQAVNIIDRRVNGLGVANSTVQRQGSDVVIELPGIKDSQRALAIIGTTAQLFFRPVICSAPAYAAPVTSPSTTTPKSSTTTAPGTAKLSPSTTVKKSAAGATGRDAALTAVLTKGATTTTTVAKTSSTTAPASTTTTTPATGNSTSSTSTKNPYAYLADYCGTSTSTPLPKGAPASASALPSTSPNNDNANYTVIIPSSKASGYGTDRWILGPADLRGEIVSTASAAVDTQTGDNVVNVTLTSRGLTEFNKVATVRHQYYSATAASPDPRSLEAIDLDGQLESAPTIESAPFTGPIQISGSFTTSQASALADELRYGSLPVRFTAGNINSISATLGHSSLIAGLLAGVGGLLLVMLYMILYYRALGLVVILGLAVGGALLYSILTELSYTSSLALTLSGIVGVIVSIGITVDSYVVYFERLKDEVRQGRTVRASVERGFTRAFKTVLTADLVSFMAALILYLFTVGDVKGFAFTLGLSTLLDVFTAYFFIRPIVVLLGRRRTTSETRFLGIARGLGSVRPESAR